MYARVYDRVFTRVGRRPDGTRLFQKRGAYLEQNVRLIMSPGIREGTAKLKSFKRYTPRWEREYTSKHEDEMREWVDIRY